MNNDLDETIDFLEGSRNHKPSRIARATGSKLIGHLNSSEIKRGKLKSQNSSLKEQEQSGTKSETKYPFEYKKNQVITEIKDERMGKITQVQYDRDTNEYSYVQIVGKARPSHQMRQSSGQERRTKMSLSSQVQPLFVLEKNPRATIAEALKQRSENSTPDEQQLIESAKIRKSLDRVADEKSNYPPFPLEGLPSKKLKQKQIGTLLSEINIGRQTVPVNWNYFEEQKKSANENYLEENFIENLIKKRQAKQVSLKQGEQVRQPRACVDFRYLKVKEQQEVERDIQKAKEKGRERLSQGFDYNRLVAPPKMAQDVAPMDENFEDSSEERASENTIIVKKIDKSIEIKEQEHLEMRDRFLKLVQQPQGSPHSTPGSTELEQTDKPHWGEENVKVLSLAEWNSLLCIFRTDLQFDPLQVVSRDRMRKTLLNGIPASMRGEIWCMLCRSQREKAMHGEGMYQKLLDPSQANPGDELRIKKDITRTFTNYPSDIVDFNWKSKKGQKLLYNVLLAYSNYDSQIGYVQGMNYIAGMLLMHTKDDEQAFWCLLYIMNRKNWRCIYEHKMTKLMDLLDSVEQRLKIEFPALSEHLEENDFTIGAAFSPLFITLYIYQIDHQFAMRIFESFILDGELALLRVLFKMIKLKEKKVLGMEEIELIMYLRTNIINECIEELGIETLLEDD